MPFKNEHAARQTDPRQYYRFARGNPDGFPDGVSAVYGFKPGGGSEIQSVRFDSSKWTPGDAREWLKSHDMDTGLETATAKELVAEQYVWDALDKARDVLPGWAWAVLRKAACMDSFGWGNPRVLQKRLPLVFAWPTYQGEITYEEDLGVFDQRYLGTAGITRDQVQIVNPAAVDQDVHGVVVALGKRARDELGDRADHWLPHPAAVRKFGPSNELGRKMTAVMKSVAQFGCVSVDDDDDQDLAMLLYQAPEGAVAVMKAYGEKIRIEFEDQKPIRLDVTGVWDEAQKALATTKTVVGKYRLGAAQKDKIEIMLDVPGLDGRYLLVKGSGSQDSGWLIEKPADQKPTDETADVADITGQLKRQGHEYLIWKTADGYECIDVRTGQQYRTLEVGISKADDAKRIVYGVVLDPYQVDLDNDWSPPGAIEDTAHKWFRDSRVIGLRHKSLADAYPVESWIVPYPSEDDYCKALAGEPHRAYRQPFGKDTMHSGAWVVGTKLSKRLWTMHKSGDIDAYSIGGYSYRTPANRKVMPAVEFIDLTQ